MELHEIIEKSKNLRNSLDNLIDILIKHEDLFTTVSGDWRVKDVLLHISWHEEICINIFQY